MLKNKADSDIFLWKNGYDLILFYSWDFFFFSVTSDGLDRLNLDVHWLGFGHWITASSQCSQTRRSLYLPHRNSSRKLPKVLDWKSSRKLPKVLVWNSSRTLPEVLD